MTAGRRMAMRKPTTIAIVCMNAIAQGKYGSAGAVAVRVVLAGFPSRTIGTSMVVPFDAPDSSRIRSVNGVASRSTAAPASAPRCTTYVESHQSLALRTPNWYAGAENAGSQTSTSSAKASTARKMPVVRPAGTGRPRCSSTLVSMLEA